MRMIGFKIKDISIYWLIQDLIFIIISIILAVPFTLFLSKALLDYASSNRQIYPFEIDIKIILFSVLFTVGVILISHIISMIKINKWNLADNTRSKD
jgi:ABC-type antimicrobial peptide transport system permease subunit